MIFNAQVLGLSAALNNLASLEDRAMSSSGRAMGRTVLAGQGIVRGRASGRPGPRAVTGDYRRSIVGDWAQSGTTTEGAVGTNGVQGPRLERGFVGPDILGRVYDQPPFPHFEPSVPEIQQIAVAEHEAEIKGALS